MISVRSGINSSTVRRDSRSSRSRAVISSVGAMKITLPDCRLDRPLVRMMMSSA